MYSVSEDFFKCLSKQRHKIHPCIVSFVLQIFDLFNIRLVVHILLVVMIHLRVIDVLFSGKLDLVCWEL